MERAGGLVVDIAERYIEEKLLRAARVVVTDVLIVLAHLEAVRSASAG
jgi:hypothetical protein